MDLGLVGAIFNENKDKNTVLHVDHLCFEKSFKTFPVDKKLCKTWELWNMTATSDNVKNRTEQTSFYSHQIKNIGNILQ